MKIVTIIIFLFVTFCSEGLYGEDGYRLWLRYDLIPNQQILTEYKNLITGLMIDGDSPGLTAYGLRQNTLG